MQSEKEMRSAEKWASASMNFSVCCFKRLNWLFPVCSHCIDSSALKHGPFLCFLGQIPLHAAIAILLRGQVLLQLLCRNVVERWHNTLCRDQQVVWNTDGRIVDQCKEYSTFCLQESSWGVKCVCALSSSCAFLGQNHQLWGEMVNLWRDLLWSASTLRKGLS